jgi:hypothetical protein
MNLSQFSRLVLCGASISGICRASELITNGGFEDSPALNGWSTVRSPSLAESPDVSPFDSPYGPSSESVHFVQNSNGRSTLLWQDFGVADIKARLTFDFKVSSLSDGVWYVLPGDRSDTDGSTSFLMNFLIGNDGQFLVASDSPDHEFDESLVLNEWYHVVTNFDFTIERFSGSITQFGGATETWTDFPIFDGSSLLNAFQVSNLPLGANSPEFFLDNVSVDNGLVTTSPVPEPSTYALVGVAGLVLLAVRRRQRAKA